MPSAQSTNSGAHCVTHGSIIVEKYGSRFQWLAAAWRWRHLSRLRGVSVRPGLDCDASMKVHTIAVVVGHYAQWGGRGG